MKPKLILCLIAFGTLLLSCRKDDDEPNVVKGSLTVNVGLFISVNEVENKLKSVQGVEDFMVIICNNSGQVIQTFDRASDMPPEIELDPGQYYVAAHSNNDLGAAFENPYYYGESDLFSIIPGGQLSVTVNCELANSMVTIVYSEQVRTNYTDYTTTVSSSAGSLIFTAQETRPGYFHPLPLTISVLLTWQKGDGSIETKTLSGNIPDPRPRKNYEIHIDASPAQGASSLLIYVDENTDPVEIISITDSVSSDSGSIVSGSVIISEIMFNPAALDDAQGEWFELYNTTGSPIDLNQTVIRKNDTEQHTVNESLIIPPHGYMVLSRTSAAFTGTGYIYGTSISLNNTGAILALYNYGTNGTDGAVICSVNYGSDGFPTANGASISLSPELMNGTSATLGASWCVSITAFHTGDTGTPGASNDACL
jgi:hypothetical protein